MLLLLVHVRVSLNTLRLHRWSLIMFRMYDPKMRKPSFRRGRVHQPSPLAVFAAEATDADVAIELAVCSSSSSSSSSSSQMDSVTCDLWS